MEMVKLNTKLKECVINGVCHLEKLLSLDVVECIFTTQSSNKKYIAEKSNFITLVGKMTDKGKDYFLGCTPISIYKSFLMGVHNSLSFGGNGQSITMYLENRGKEAAAVLTALGEASLRVDLGVIDSYSQPVIVRKDEAFSFNTVNNMPCLNHDAGFGGTGEIVGGYVVFTSKGVTIPYLFNSDDFKRWRDKAKSQNVWNEHLSEMLKTKILRHAAKRLPLFGVDMSAIFTEDDYSEGEPKEVIEANTPTLEVVKEEINTDSF